MLKGWSYLVHLSLVDLKRLLIESLDFREYIMNNESISLDISS